MKENISTTSNVDEITSLFSNTIPGSLNPGELFRNLGEASEKELADLRNFALARGVKEHAFKQAQRDWYVKRELGCFPSTSLEFVEAYCEKHQITASYNGTLDKPSSSEFASDYDSVDLERDVHLEIERLGLKFNRYSVGYAIGKWIDNAKPAHRERVWAVINDPDAPAADEEWSKFVKALVDTSQVSVAYAIAANRKFIWQVKRKMQGLHVTNHVMVVYSGPQGNGKTTAIGKLLSVIEGMDRRVTFSEITDGRNKEMWRSYVLFTDEMERAAKADVEAIKNAITSETADIRILGTNSMVNVRRYSTMIGATNGTLGSNIRDVTGLRRFAPIPTLGRPGHSATPVDWEAINSIDFAALWQSVQATDPDPVLDHMKELDRLQEDEREKPPVELWLESLKPGGTWVPYAKCGISASDLFQMYVEFEEQEFRSLPKLTLPTWGRAMKVEMDKAGSAALFTKRRRGNSNHYFPNPKLQAAPIDQRVAASLEAA